MTQVTGNLIHILNEPSQVAEVRVAVQEDRPAGTGIALDDTPKATYDRQTGVVAFDAIPGPAMLLLKWVGETTSKQYPMLIPDTGPATLRECVEAVMLADEGTITALERLALEVTDMVATIQNIALLEEWADSAKTEADRAAAQKVDLDALSASIDTKATAYFSDYPSTPANTDGVSAVGYSANAGRYVSLDDTGKMVIVTSQINRLTDVVNVEWVNNPTRGVSTSGFSANASKPVFLDNQGKLNAYLSAITEDDDVTSKAYVDDLTYAPMQHQVRADAAVKRHGYTVPTNGRGVVMLRFDDYPQDFITKVLPLLREYDLPAYWAATVRHVETEQPTPWADVQGWFLNDGIRIWNHSKTHSNSTPRPAIRDNIVGAADYFEEQMPHVTIDGWVQPGTGTSTPYNDFSYGSLESYWSTYAGRLIMGRHGIINGGVGGYMQPMGGRPVAQSHYTFERASAGEFKAQVQIAQSGPYALSMMAHPKFLGTTGYMSMADFESCLSWLAAERDAGRLMVLTGDVAPALTPGGGQRNDLTPRFPPGALANTMMATLETGPVYWAGGGTREFEATITADAQTVVELEVAGSVVAKKKQFTIPAGTTTIRTFFGMPRGFTTMNFWVRRISGGTATLREAHVYAA